MKTGQRMWKSITIAIVSCLALASAGYGQDMAEGQVEATGLVGIVTGNGTHGTVGVNAGKAVRERVFAYGEFFYVPGGGGSFESPGFEASSSSRGIGFNAGAQYMFPTSGMWKPYAGGGLGVVHGSVSFSTTVGGVVINEGRISNTDFFVNFGGGLRYYINDRWGFKPEVMIFAGGDTFVRLAGGLFYHFGK
jgi:hypothetical protein